MYSRAAARVNAPSSTTARKYSRRLSSTFGTTSKCHEVITRFRWHPSMSGDDHTPHPEAVLAPTGECRSALERVCGEALSTSVATQVTWTLERMVLLGGGSLDGGTPSQARTPLTQSSWPWTSGLVP